MPNENEKTATPVAAVPDQRDAEITSLKKQLENLGKENAALSQDLDSARKELKAKPKAAAAPSGDYCVLGGKTYPVAGTVSCRFATDEGRKGHIELDSELVILKR